MAVQAVLFDIDGTLVDSNEAHVTSWGFAFQEEGRPQELDDIRGQIGKGGDLLVPALLPDSEEALRKRIADRHGERFKDLYLDHVRAFDGARAIVERVHAAGIKVVLASSAKQDELDHYVELLGIEQYLAATTSSDDVDASKPEPDIFGTALQKVGIEPADAMVVGDTPYDVEAALRAGVPAVGLTSGPFSEERLRDAGAIAVYAGIADLLADFDRSPFGRQQLSL